MKYKIFNCTKKNYFLDNIKIAETYYSRLKGLLDRTNLEKGEGLVIRPCRSIHTIGMKFPIDVAFIDRDHRVIYIMEDLPKDRFSPIVKEAEYVVEARAGEIKARKLEVGDRIRII